MRNYITYAGINLATSYGVYISGSGVFNAPGRALEKIVIPGRNGEFINKVSRLENIIVTYPAFIVREFQSNLAGLRAFLLSDTVGYKNLYDTYNPGYYRRACFSGPLNVEPTALLNAGSFELAFDCMPQLWLVSGDTNVELTASDTITNPTRFDAKPLIYIYGTGKVKIRDTEINVNSSMPNAYVVIDCDTGLIWNSAGNMGKYVSFSTLDLPVLKSGNNAITLYTGINKVEIKPRWWTL